MLDRCVSSIKGPQFATKCHMGEILKEILNWLIVKSF